MDKDQIKIAWVIVVLIILFTWVLKSYDYTIAAIDGKEKKKLKNDTSLETALNIIKELEEKSEKFTQEQKILVDRLVLTYESVINQLITEKEDLQRENEMPEKKIEFRDKTIVWRINDLNPALERPIKKILHNRIKYIHDKANPEYPLPKKVIERYVEWTYKWAKKSNIPVLFFAAIPETEANWVSKDSYDYGNSWTAFSMQIGTIRSILMNMGYPIPKDDEGGRAQNNSLNHKIRYRNFINMYKVKLMDENLDMKELTFEVAAEHIKWLYQRYNGNLARVAEAYNKGHSPTHEISTNYPMNALGRYYYLLFQLYKEINRNNERVFHD